MPSRVNWPVMGGPTAHPTGITLASGDPPNSLNAPGGSLGRFRLLEAVQGLVLLEDLEQYLVLAGTVGAGGRSERGSGTQSDPPLHIGSSEEVFCPAVGQVANNRVLRPRNPDTGGGQEDMEVAER